MPKTIYLCEINPASRCYLKEVLYWSAFGRFPEELYFDGGVYGQFEPWRFSPLIRTTEVAPIPAVEDHIPSLKGHLFPLGAPTEDECAIAGIKTHPLVSAYLGDRPGGNIEATKQLIANYKEMQCIPEYQNSDDEKRIHSKIDELEHELGLLQGLTSDLGKWNIEYENYTKNYKLNILKKLSRKNTALTAYGSLISKEKLQDQNFSDLTAKQISPDMWKSWHVDFEKSLIHSGEFSIIWIYLDGSSIFDEFSPKFIPPKAKPVKVGHQYAVSIKRPNDNMGRPNKHNWIKFHDMLSEKCKAGELWEEKDAMAQELADSFEKMFGTRPTPGQIHAIIKPYYDGMENQRIRALQQSEDPRKSEE